MDKTLPAPKAPVLPKGTLLLADEQLEAICAAILYTNHHSPMDPSQAVGEARRIINEAKKGDDL